MANGSSLTRRKPRPEYVARRPSLAPLAEEPLPKQLTDEELQYGAIVYSKGVQRRRYSREKLENMRVLWNALWRRAHAEHSAAFRTSLGQLEHATGLSHDTVAEHGRILEAMGLLKIGGETDEEGRLRCTYVRLLDPEDCYARRPWGYSSVGRATRCRVRSRRCPETRLQRRERRFRPYRRKAGRGRTCPAYEHRITFFGGSNFRSPDGDLAPAPTGLGGEGRSQTCVRAGPDASRDGRGSTAARDRGGGVALAAAAVELAGEGGAPAAGPASAAVACRSCGAVIPPGAHYLLSVRRCDDCDRSLFAELTGDADYGPEREP